MDFETIFPARPIEPCGSVFLRKMSFEELLQLHGRTHDEAGKPKPDAKHAAELVAATLCDADGNRVFTPELVQRIADADGPKVAQIFKRCQELNQVDSAKN